MKKYVEHGWKVVLGALLIGLIYLQIDIRDFIKYEQPERDSKQDAFIMNVKEYCQNEVEAQRERNTNMNSRIDKSTDESKKFREDLTEIKTYQQIILNHLRIIRQEQAYNN
jgi:hypothetical protein